MLKEIIKKLGISRRALAVFLQSDPGNLSRYENNTRNLPFAAIPQVAKLLAMIHKAPPTALPQPTTEEKEEARKRSGWCRVLLRPQQQKLAAMQQRYEQAQLMLSVLVQYTQSAEVVSPQIKSWIAGQQYAANKKREDNGWQAQQAVLQKINALEAEARFWEYALDPVKLSG